MRYKVKFNLYEYNEYHYPYSETIKTIFIDAATYDQCRDIVQFRYPRAENIVIDVLGDNARDPADHVECGNSVSLGGVGNSS